MSAQKSEEHYGFAAAMAMDFLHCRWRSKTGSMSFVSDMCWQRISMKATYKDLGQQSRRGYQFMD